MTSFVPDPAPTAAPAEGSRRTDTITLSGLRARGHHGVLAIERKQGQVFVVDLVLEVDLRPAAASDDLADTVNYAEVAADAVSVVEGPPADLIETVAERIAASALLRGGVQAVEVTVHKPQAPVGVPFADVSVHVRRERAVPVVIALGANEGSPDTVRATLLSAVRNLGAVDGLTLRQVSRLFRTRPVGGPVQPDYLNAVVLASTRLPPVVLLGELQAIEARHGRRRDIRWGPRTLDLDLIQYGDPAAGSDTISSAGGLTLPHPRAAERAFVLRPWLDADPLARFRHGPDVVAVSELLEALGTLGAGDGAGGGCGPGEGGDPGDGPGDGGDGGYGGYGPGDDIGVWPGPGWSPRW